MLKLIDHTLIISNTNHKTFSQGIETEPCIWDPPEKGREPPTPPHGSRSLVAFRTCVGLGLAARQKAPAAISQPAGRKAWDDEQRRHLPTERTPGGNKWQHAPAIKIDRSCGDGDATVQRSAWSGRRSA